MFTQPTVNQIASTYQGNPAPLARKVDQDKKQNGGIPKDLRQLMALNDIAQGKNSVGIDQALQIPTNMPTVAQATQAQAQQAIQARLMQMAREQQRLQQKPPTLPVGTPQPEEQPQGLDMLETNVGGGYAEGGIIGFDDGGRVQHFQSKGLVSGSLSDAGDSSETFDILADRPREAARKKAEQEAEEKMRFLEVAAPEVAERIKKEKPQVSGTPVSLPAQQLPTASIRSQLNAADAASRSQPGTPPPPRERPAAQTQTRVNADSAPMPGALQGLAGIPSTSAAYKKLTDMMNQDPEAKAQELRERYKKEVGDRDLSIYDKTTSELEARKQKIAQQRAPKSGFEGLMDYLDNIAEAGGKTWYDAGSRGGALQKKKRLALEEQENALMDKILELGGKKSEAQYAEKKGMFDLTSKERDEIFKRAFDAAKSVNSSDDEAKRLAAQAVENEKNRLNQIRSAQIGAQDRDNLMSRAKALMAADPSKKMTLEQAMQRAAEIGAAGQMESAEVTRRKNIEKGIADIDKKYGLLEALSLNPKNPKYVEMKAARDKEVREYMQRQGGGVGIDTLPATSASGTVPPPPGFRVN
jgi:hypothetical protein